MGQYRIIFLGIVLLVFGCSGNTLVISTVYNGLDTKMAKRFYQYADFNEKQLAAIKGASEAYHLWHRKLQLPQYVRLLDDIHRKISTGEEISMQQVKQWSNSLYGFRDELFICNPINYSAVFLKTLSDNQVSQFESRFEVLEKEKSAEKNHYSENKMAEKQWNKTLKIFKRSGLRLDPQQQGWLKETLNNTDSLDKQWDSHWTLWKADFIVLLATRDHADFDTNITELFKRLRRSTQHDNSAVIAANHDHWNRFVVRLIGSLNNKQKNEFLSVLDNLKNTLNTLSHSSSVTDDSELFQTPAACRV